jgi:prepilin-type N-terminal cleavage/methylation domain-containing protein
MKNKGFTIIELMIVIVIIGIASAVVLPLLTGNTNVLVQNGTICEPIVPGSHEGLAYSVSQGYRQQVIGTNGLPLGCEIN